MQITCDHCDVCRDSKPTKNGGPRLPRGWKRLGEAVWCVSCWRKTYALRAITIPVAHCDWDAVRPAVREAQRAVTELSNWAVRQLLANDVVRTPDMEKLPDTPPCYLYRLAGEQFHGWSRLAKATAADVLQQVQKRYRDARLNVIWLCKQAPPTYRYPQPVPVRPDSFNVGLVDEQLVFSVRLGGARHALTLRGGARYRRQKASLEWLLSHPELFAQAAIIEAPASRDSHRPVAKARANGNGARRYSQLRVKFVGWFPVREADRSDNTLSVRTDTESLVVAFDHAGERVWTYHADHARRIVARHMQHLSRLGRLSDDHKAERRKPRRDGRRAMTTNSCGRARRRGEARVRPDSACRTGPLAERSVSAGDSRALPACPRNRGN